MDCGISFLPLLGYISPAPYSYWQPQGQFHLVHWSVSLCTCFVTDPTSHPQPSQSEDMIPVTVADMLSKCQDPVCAKFDRFGSKLSDLEKTSASMSSHHEEDP